LLEKDKETGGLVLDNCMPNKGLLLLTGRPTMYRADGTYPKGLGVETSMFEYTGFSTAYGL
jgi:hypothetical protein